MKYLIKYIVLFFPLIVFSQDFNNFKGNKIKADASFQFTTAYYYDYQINSSNITDSIYIKVNYEKTPEGLLTQSFSNLFVLNQDSIINQLVVYSKIIISYNQKEWCFIKFKTKEKELLSKNQVFILSKSDSLWNKKDSINEIINSVKTILSLKNNAFLQFEVAEDNPSYPEINKLKPLVKDADGVLNIFKLADVIEKNKSILGKYLDE